MDDTLLFIPPCCVDKKLPKAIMQAPRRSLTFYTHGDVMFEKFFRAIAYLVVDPCAMVLSMPKITTSTFAFFQQCFERKWITDLMLLSKIDVTKSVERYLYDYIDRIAFTQSDSVSLLSSHMVLYTDKSAILLDGPMLDSFCEFGLMSYNLSLFNSFEIFSNKLDYGNPIRNILIPDVMMMRKTLKPKRAMNKSKVIEDFLFYDFPAAP